MSKNFYLTQRKSGVWYVKFVDQTTGKITTTKSTGETNKKAAENQAYKWLASGFVPNRRNAKTDGRLSLPIKSVIASLSVMDISEEDAHLLVEELIHKHIIESAVISGTRSAEPLADFLLRFWTWEESPYIKEKHLYNHSIHKFYVSRNLGMVKTHWIPFFKDRSIGSMTKQDIKKFQSYLSSLGLSPESINQTTRCGVIALKWAFNNGIVVNDCFTGLTFCAIRHKKREILTLEQASAVFHIEWKSQYSKLANMTAMCTGMRAGEIQALQYQDIGTDRLYVRHNWARGGEGLKSCKNGEEREVPIPPQLRDALIKQAESNPYNEGLKGFVFWGLLPDQPMDAKPWLTALRKALKEIGYDDPNKICFHAWRHLYSARMADLIDQRKLQRATGHKTAAMLEHYANHAKESDFKDLEATADKLFIPIIE